MKQVAGVWLPDDEVHLAKNIINSPRVGGRGTHQHHKLTEAMRYVRQRRLALDVGMHVGLWAVHLSRLFDEVLGFEPVATHRECLARNMEGLSNWRCLDVAIGDRKADVGMRFLPGSTGSTHVDPAGGSGVRMMRLDDFVFDGQHVDFVKIDVEGHELQVVAGGEQTIRGHRPVVIVEQKPGKCEYYGGTQHAARDLLASWGMREVFNLQGDACMVWK